MKRQQLEKTSAKNSKKITTRIYKKKFNETPKPNSMGCYHVGAQSWKETLEGKTKFELMY